MTVSELTVSELAVSEKIITLKPCNPQLILT